MKKNDKSLSQIRNIYVLTTIFMVALSFYAFVQIRNLISSSGIVNHANEVTQSLQKISSAIISAETNQRGYLLTGDSQMFAKRDLAFNTLDFQMKMLDRLVKNDPLQSENSTVLKSMVKNKLLSMNKELDGYHPMRMDLGFRAEIIEGIQKMDIVAQQINNMLITEKEIIEVRTQKYAQLIFITAIYIIVFSIGSLIILFTSYFSINNAFGHSQTLQKKLEHEKSLAESIINSSVENIYVLDMDLCLLSISKNALEIIGLERGKIIGKNILDIIPEIKESSALTDLYRALKGEKVHNKQYYSPLTKRYYENFYLPLRINTEINGVVVMAHDITEIILASKKLKQTNQALEEAQRLARVGSWEWDVVKNILIWSPMMYKMYGVQEGDGISFGKFESLLHGDDRDFVINHINNAMETLHFQEFDHRIVTPEGIVKIMHSKGQVITNDNGEVIWMLGTGQDITTTREAEQKLENRNQFVETLINSSPDLITVIDKDLRIITINKNALELVNTSYNGDVIGKKVTEVSPHIISSPAYLDMLKAFKEETIISNKTKAVFSNKYYKHSYIPLRNPNKAVYAVMVISHDITGIVQNELKFQELNETFNYAEQVGLFGSYSYNFETQQLSYSDNMFRLLGCEPQEFPSKPENFNKFVHPNDMQYVIDATTEAFTHKHSSKCEYRIIRKDGKTIDVRGTGKVITNSENAQCMIGTLQDITEEKNQENNLYKQNRDLENMNKELQSFAYISSHDLQEPLRKIQTFSTRIVEKEYDNLSDTGKDHFNRMQGAARRMQTLIEDLLSYSRTNTDERLFEDNDLKLIIEEVKDELKEELLHKKAIVESTDTDVCFANIIRFQFKQLLQNLISNSLKFSLPEYPPHIKIKSEIVKGRDLDNEKLSPNKNYCHLKYTDNGIGFEPQYSEKIFEVFQRLHGRENYTGTGIGLAIVKKIVENHHGIISAKGETDKGATFDIYFPATKE